MYADYAPKGVQFRYIYKALAHPEHQGYVTPFTLRERLLHVQEARRTLGSKIPWICDTMANDLKHALGDMPNSEFVLDPEGRVVRKRAWSNPEQLRRDLAELVGPVEKPTRVADLNLPQSPERERPGDSALPRVRLPGRMQAVRVEPLLKEGDPPFYVKLRAEADGALLEQRRGQLYLGFYLDPLYGVHWNNQAAPLRYEIQAPPGVTVTPAAGQAPRVSAAEDRSPREFLVDVRAAEGKGPLELTVWYVACDDAATFCLPIKQQYRVQLERDPDGGQRRSAGGPGGPGGGRPGGPPGRPGSPRAFYERLLEADRNRDGKVSREEAPEGVRRMFDRLDTNGDGVLDQAELKAAAQRFQEQGGPGAPAPAGPRPASEVSRLGLALLRVLDANGDGVLGGSEIDRAAALLRSLDRNGDGKVTPEELEEHARSLERKP